MSAPGQSVRDGALSLLAKAKAYAKAQAVRQPEALVRSDSPLGRAATPLAKVPDSLLKAAARALPSAGPDPKPPWAGNLDAFQAQICECQRCPLGAGRKKLVFGEGSARAQVVFVGGAPGAEEDATGRPFVGPPGLLLDKIINAMALPREQVYLLNLVKCRPPLNREPGPVELAACAPYWQQQLVLLKPKVIVALGEQASQALLGTGLEQARRDKQRFHGYQGALALATHHPAEVLRNAALKRPVWDDMKLVVEQLRPTA